MRIRAKRTGTSAAQRVNPGLVIVAREARGMTQAELAAACEVSQGLMSRIEAGLSTFPEDRIPKLARVLGVLPDFFASDGRVGALGSTCLLFRRRQSLPVKKLRWIIAVVNMRRMQIERLLRSVEVQEQKFVSLDIDEYGPPERIAQLFRRVLNLPMGPVPNLIGTIESAGGIVVKTDFETEQFDAASQWFEDSQPIFFVNSRMPTDRMRLTLAHEIGHVLMHTVAPIDAERQANEFAGEFLMPANEIRADLEPVTVQHLAELKMHWKVSMASLLYRARELEVITSGKFRSMMMLLGKLGYRRREPVALPAEEPALLREIVTFHRTEHGFSIEDLARLMQVPMNEIPPEFLPQGLRVISA